MRVPAPAHRSPTVMPSGAMDDWGSRPRVRATFFAGIDWMVWPSSSTRPSLGLSIRDSARRSVDLPHALGPTITVKELSGIVHRQLLGDHPLVVGEGDVLGGQTVPAILRFLLISGPPCVR
ncbi:hypothetical protein SVIOM74S_02509 [Streptomyces violarus]